MKTLRGFALLATWFAAPAATVDRFTQLPLAFEAVAQDNFVARSGDLALCVGATGATVGERGMRIEGANPAARGDAETMMPGTRHYLIGNDPRRWRTDVPIYGRVRFHDVYPGVDLVYYGNRRELEFDFILAPGVAPSSIRLRLSGPDVSLREPRIYQGRRTISGHAIRRGHRVSFRVRAYDRSRPLVIDPVLSFATIFGGGGADSGSAVAVDGAGSIYVTGTTSSANFPLVGAYESTVNSNRHTFVAKLTADGTGLVYCTYLGGSGTETAGGIAVDAGGSVYVSGSTTSADFPGTNNSQGSAGGSQVFAVKLSPDGSKLLYSTYVGQPGESGGTIALDRTGNAYVTHGMSVSKLDGNGKEAYSTTLGLLLRSIAVDDSGNAYAVGSTLTGDLMTRNAFQSQLRGQNAYIAKLDGRGSVVYATYLGGAGVDFATAIAVDAAGSAYVTGSTTSTNFPTVLPLQANLSAALAYRTADGGASWSRSDSGLNTQPRFLAVDPANSTNVYSIANQRLYRSTDGGARWLPAAANYTVYSLAISPSTPSTIYASVTDAQRSVAIVRSTDAGATWSTVSGRAFTASKQAFLQLLVDPANPSTVYGGARASGSTDGFFKSTDGGVTWKAYDFLGPGNGVWDMAIARSTPSNLFLVLGAADGGFGGGYNRVFSSADGGENWNVVDVPPKTDIVQIAVDPHDSSVVYAAAGVVLKSTDGGVAFSHVGDVTGVNVLAVDPINTATLYAGTGTGVYKSTDGGDHWKKMSNGLPAANISVLALAAGTPSTLFVATPGDQDGFVAKLSRDGSQLDYSTYLGGRGSDSISAVAVDADGSAYVAGSSSATDFPLQDPFRADVRMPGASDGFVAKLSVDGSKLVWSSFLGGGFEAGIAVGPSGGVYVTGSTSSAVFPTSGSIQPWTGTTLYQSTDGGANWSGQSALAGRNIVFLAVNPKVPSNVFAGTTNGLFLSTDNGANWDPVVASGPFGALAFDPVNPSIVYTGSPFGVSTNGGLNWTFNFRVLLGFVYALAIDSKTPATMYAATSSGIYKSTDAGGSWMRVLTDNNVLRGIVVDPQNPSTLYAAGPSVRKSTDGGATWNATNRGIPSDATITLLAIDPYSPSVLYAAGTGGIFRSYDGGTSWSAINSGLRLQPGSGVTALMVDPANAATLYAATPAGGVYHSTDHGESWMGVPLGISTVQALAVDPTNDSRVYAGALLNSADAFVVRIVE